ncbi:hypothetical protein EW145_g4422 [Phellinidium pouzarii]|uniref:Uncharacterized protein n=1 Tax=Phellinidium pouzarii TaxID=167371 RepID=A0A4S4L406_9AGAM|nr:hypothetical protein EW145_g4422 [Phellinidium pouzarii]
MTFPTINPMLGILDIVHVLAGVKQLPRKLACLFRAAPDSCTCKQADAASNRTSRGRRGSHSSSSYINERYISSECAHPSSPRPARWSGMVRPILTYAQLEAALSENRRSLIRSDFLDLTGADDFSLVTGPGLRPSIPESSSGSRSRRLSTLERSPSTAASSYGRGLTPPPDHFRRRARARVSGGSTKRRSRRVLSRTVRNEFEPN